MMDADTQARQDACLRALRPLVGRRIRALVRDEAGLSGFETDDGTRVWILCDPEGNGPGFADVVPGPRNPEGATT
jgi:hypothetical protein